VKKRTKIVALILVIAVFMTLALGSNSKKSDVSEVSGGADVVSGDENGASAAKAEYTIGDGIVNTWTSSIGSAWISVAVPVKNTGSVDLYIESATIDIEYSDGTIADTLQYVSGYPQIVKPGETAWYYEATLFDGKMGDTYKAIPHAKVEEASHDCIRFETSEIQIDNDEYFGVNVHGRVLNNTSEEATSVYVAVNFFGADGNLLAQGYTILSDGLAAGDKIGFEVNDFNGRFTASEVASYEVYAFPYQYQF